jgi:hypothetical protein
VQKGLNLENFTMPGHALYSWHQPGLLFPRFAYEQVGGLDTSLRYAMDHDLMCRFLRLNLPVVYLDKVVAGFRLHDQSKTMAENTYLALETMQVKMRYWHLLQISKLNLAVRMLVHLILRSLKLLSLGKYANAFTNIHDGTRILLDKPVSE